MESEKPNYEIVQTKIIKGVEPITIPELRYYNIDSYLDGVAMMYAEFGGWDEKKKGKYNGQEYIWNDVSIPNLEGKYNLVVDGHESVSNSYASFIVYDAEYYPCFAENHPSKDAITKYLMEKLSALDSSQIDYSKF